MLAVIVLLPTARAQSIDETCVDALASEGQRWDGPPMETFTWDGTPVDAGSIEISSVTVCRANGPLEILPPVQFIGCVLVDGRLATIGGSLGCGAYRDVRLDADGALIWIARSNGAADEVSRLLWSGAEFYRDQTYTACWDDPFTAVGDPVDCGR